MVIITSTINIQVYVEILDNFLIPSIENWFSDDEAIFRMMIHVVTEQKGLKLFLLKSHIKSVICPMTSPDRNPIENLRWTFKNCP